MIDFIGDKISEFSKNNSIIFRQDSNAKVVISHTLDSNGIQEFTVRKYGDPNANVKGKNLMNLAKANELRIANTWFLHKS